MKVLFVDDEAQVLRGLRRLLNFMSDEWEMEFVTGGQEALEFMERGAADVVVTDMRMPGMNGAELLTQVHARWPGTVRIILSGYADREATLRTVGTAHQYLSKPCDPEVLVATITRMHALCALLNDEPLRKLVQGMQSLPSRPTLYHRMLDALQQPEISMPQIGELVAQDAGMTARILQLVNSSFFGQQRHISSVAQAISLIGLDTIRALVLSIGVFSQFEPGLGTRFPVEKIWRHSMRVGKLAKEIACSQDQSRGEVEDAFASGLLHDAGKLILAANMPAPYAKVLALVKAKKLFLAEVERLALGASHAEVGGYLLGLWGLPHPIVEAVAYHHQPQPQHAIAFSALTAVHAANCLENERDGDDEMGGAAALDEDYIASLGLADRIPAWRELCRTLE
ncbi:MAG TPA: response regulator [Chthonomonadaceae bacterium]|nr:response regulator [Chthonomonadaceae bacterium]